MDPMLFGVDGELVFEVLGTIVLLSFLLERALAVVFEWRPLVPVLSERGLKEPIAIGTALILCFWKNFDALAIIFRDETTTKVGLVLTALIIAGGSKGAVKLFHDVFNWKSNALREHEATQALGRSLTRSTSPPSSTAGAGQPG